MRDNGSLDHGLSVVLLYRRRLQTTQLNTCAALVDSILELYESPAPLRAHTLPGVATPRHQTPGTRMPRGGLPSRKNPHQGYPEILGAAQHTTAISCLPRGASRASPTSRSATPPIPAAPGLESGTQAHRWCQHPMWTGALGLCLRLL